MLRITLDIFDDTKSKMTEIPDGNSERQLRGIATKKENKVKKFKYGKGDFDPSKKDSYYPSRSYMAGK